MSKKLGLENKYRGLKPNYLQYPVITSVKPNVTGKMGGGMMMKYKTGSKDVVKGKKFVADIDDKVMAAFNTAKGALSYLKDDASLGIKSLKKAKMNAKAKRLTKTEGSFSKGNAVKLSPKQKKIAAMAGNPNEIDAPDFAKLRSMKANKGVFANIMKPGKMEGEKAYLKRLKETGTSAEKKAYGYLKAKGKTEDRLTRRDVQAALKAIGVNVKKPSPEIKATGARMGKMMKAKTGEEAKISKVMKEYKEGKLNIGKSKKKVKNKKQAIAIALSEARKKNA